MKKKAPWTSLILKQWLFLIILTVVISTSQCTRPPEVIKISGQVVTEEEGIPLTGATVRIQATENETITDGDGRFTLEVLEENLTVTVSAWKHDHYCAKVEGVTPPAIDITLTLRPYQTNDNPEYEWVPPIGDDSCASCKSGMTQLWLENAHAGAGTNPRFFSMYNGTDISGTRSVFPSYQSDFPGTVGNCATCHAPGEALDEPFNTNMNALTGVNTFGVHCDLCHKIAEVYLNPATGLPYDNMPGVFSMDVRRPFPQSERYQLFFGTFDDDNVPEEDTYLPLIEKSQFCAPCHQFSFWGTPIYQSFGEWLESPYPEQGVECQTCHMPSDGVVANVAPGQGGVERDPLTIHAHTQPGAADEDLLQETVEMRVQTDRIGDLLQVTVTITNTQAGHHVPTDYPGRHMLLIVEVTDEDKQVLPKVAGSTIPDWGGDFAGQPGIIYAKVLRDVENNDFPVVSYWKQTIIVSDNRIPAFASDMSTYTFKTDGGKASVEVNLIFRRLYQPIAELYGWDFQDIVMESAMLIVEGLSQ